MKGGEFGREGLDSGARDVGQPSLALGVFEEVAVRVLDESEWDAAFMAENIYKQLEQSFGKADEDLFRAGGGHGLFKAEGGAVGAPFGVPGEEARLDEEEVGLEVKWWGFESE